ncbi:MAG TPA: hypothetical protein VM204_04300, partial [Gaiellaceae bacterium]|nr:hypothetical protein [Gaiellaceae bacterium]
HRRWLLSEELTTIGIGSTDRYACVVVDGRSLDALTAAPAAAEAGGEAAATQTSTAPRGWVAWPPPGPVPIDVFASERLDVAGWTVQSASDDLEGAEVTVSVDGEPRPVRVTRLAPLLGSRSALRFVPDGWTTEAGRVYAVSVRGAQRIDFTVEPTDCR